MTETMQRRDGEMVEAPAGIPNARQRFITKRELDLREYKHRSPAESDYAELLTESTLLFNADTGALEIVYLVLEDDASDVAAAINRIKFGKNTRSGGLVTTSRIIGHQPRNLPNRDFCTAASLAVEDPEAHRTIAAYANKIAGYYRHYNPKLYERHGELTEKVLDEWRMEGSVFTSGIINKNNPLAYHFDAGNFSNVWSNMLVLKKDVTGGYLSVPEYDVAFALPNNSLLMFDGQSLLHGVTPIGTHSEEAYRYSIVFYSLKQMWHCLPIDEEIIRLRKRRTERERRRARGGKG